MDKLNQSTESVQIAAMKDYQRYQSVVLMHSGFGVYAFPFAYLLIVSFRSACLNVINTSTVAKHAIVFWEVPSEI